MIRIIFKITGYLFAVLLMTEVILYLSAPVYKFPEPKQFSGKKYFNPYENLDSTHWRKANFHFHTRAWGGLTSGRHNTHQAFYNTYKQLGYDAPQISNYQNIDRYYKDSVFYVPVYEHGFGVRKKHQLLIGAQKVLWFDYSLYQNLNHRQHIINKLRPNSEIVALAHPDWDKGYTNEDLKYLSNYDLVEVLNHNWRSVQQWDAALSSGHPVFIVADDDSHDIADPFEIQRCVTFINSPVINGNELINALKSGRSYGADVYMLDNETFAEKAIRARQIPRLNSVRMKGDTLLVSVSRNAFKINFIGQDGKIMKSTYLSSSASYCFKPEDTYIRTEIIFLVEFAYPKVGQGTKFFLNPIFRYDGIPPVNTLVAVYDPFSSWVLRILGGSSLFLALVLIWQMKKKGVFRKK